MWKTRIVNLCGFPKLPPISLQERHAQTHTSRNIFVTAEKFILPRNSRLSMFASETFKRFRVFVDLKESVFEIPEI